jgi:hypothetical protein
LFLSIPWPPAWAAFLFGRPRDGVRHGWVKEIERLIKKLELDKEILAEQEEDEAAN